MRDYPKPLKVSRPHLNSSRTTFVSYLMRSVMFYYLRVGIVERRYYLPLASRRVTPADITILETGGGLYRELLHSRKGWSRFWPVVYSSPDH